VKDAEYVPEKALILALIVIAAIAVIIQIR
jgi:hypothetical protein